MLLCSIAIEAGRRILPYFRKPHHARAKADRSPVTDADLAAHSYIAEALALHFRDIVAISEEDAAHAALPASGRYFLVDPLDGTLSFVRGEAEFTVNIGLVEGGVPVYGVVYAPVSEALYYGGIGIGAFRGEEEIRCRVPPPEGMVITRSRSKPSATAQAFLDTVRIAETRPASSAVKFGFVAEGSADMYPRFGRTMEWDTCAGQAIVEAAGGSVRTPDGARLSYGKKGFENPAFVVRGLAA